MIRRLLQACSALVVLAAGLVGVPWVLVRWGALPLADVSSVDRARGLVTHVVSDTALFAVLTVFAWAAWLVFVVCVVVELAATLRGVSTPRLPAAGVVQLWAARLVAALLLSFTVARPAGASTTALRPVSGVPGARQVATRLDVTTTSPQVGATATVPEPSTEASPTATSPAPPVEEATGRVVVTVEPGDSAWALAERYLHDGMRWRELWDVNRDRRQPDGATWSDPELLRPGWQLQLPADPSPVGSGPDLHLYMVVPGDDLSDIAARELGDSALAGALFDANRGRLQSDGESLTDPNLIRPGWLLTLPDQAAALQPTSPPTSAATPATAANGASAAPTPTADQAATHPSPPSSVPRTTGPRTAERGSTRSGATVAPRPHASSPTVATTTPQGARDAARAAREGGVGSGGHAVTDGGSVLEARVPFLAGIGGATFLATGLAVWLGRLRRRRSLRGARYFGRRNHDTHGSSSAVRDTERAVFAAADVPLARWAGHALASLSDGQGANGATPMVVELSAEGGLELLWDIPCPDAPGPWEVLDRGWAWRVPFDPEAPLPHDPARVMMPGLVTIGRRDDRQLLVDLEAFGTIAVGGDPVRVEDFLRAVVLELAAGDELSDAYVATVDVPCDGSEYGGRVTSVDAAGALARLSAAASAVDELLDQHATKSTFAYRATAVDAPPLETTVVVARVEDVDTVDAMRAVGGPGRGVAAILAGAAVSDGATAARVVLDADGSACLEPLGLRFCAVGLPGATAGALVELLASEALVPDDFDSEFDCDDTAQHSPTQSAALPLTRDPVGVEAGVEGDDVGVSMVDAEGSASDIPMSTAGLDAPGAAGLGSRDEDPLSSRDACSTDGSGLLVRVFGVPSVPDRPELGRREVQLTVFLACRDRPANTASVQDALWNGQAMSTKTMWNLVARTRAKLGTFPDGRAVLPPADRVQGTLKLERGVLTDLALLRDCYEQALQTSSGHAIDVLQHGVSLVDGPPFDAPGYDWAYHGEQWVADASMLIEQATVLLVELQLAAGDLDGARVAVTRGLRGLPGNEVLYRWRMRIEQQAGNLAAVRSAYRELLSFLDDLDAEPSLATCALYEELVGTGPRSRV